MSSPSYLRTIVCSAANVQARQVTLPASSCQGEPVFLSWARTMRCATFATPPPSECPVMKARSTLCFRARATIFFSCRLKVFSTRLRIMPCARMSLVSPDQREAASRGLGVRMGGLGSLG